MRYFGKSDKETLALGAMQLKADELHVKGVSVVMIVKDIDIDTDCRPVFEITRVSNRKYNFLAIVLTKLAEMFVTKRNSGRKKHKKGELGYRGGIFRRDSIKVGQLTTHYHLYTAFSGGTEDQDVEIATAGMNAMLGI